MSISFGSSQASSASMSLSVASSHVTVSTSSEESSQSSHSETKQPIYNPFTSSGNLTASLKLNTVASRYRDVYDMGYSNPTEEDEYGDDFDEDEDDVQPESYEGAGPYRGVPQDGLQGGPRRGGAHVNREDDDWQPTSADAHLSGITRAVRKQGREQRYGPGGFAQPGQARPPGQGQGQGRRGRKAGQGAQGGARVPGVPGGAGGGQKAGGNGFKAAGTGQKSAAGKRSGAGQANRSGAGGNRGTARPAGPGRRRGPAG
jgi:hypothetical protein